MLKKNDIVRLKITSMTFEGLGVGRYNDEELKDFVIFVHGTTAGDIVNCKILKVLSKYAYAIPVDFELLSDDRSEVICDKFRKCGGCNFAHINYTAELKAKKNFVEDAFHKNYQKSTCPVSEVISSPIELNYRNKVQYPISQNGRCGFYARGTHRIIEIDKCCLSDAMFEPIGRTIEEYVKQYNISSYAEQTNTGLLRHLYLRRAVKTGEIMVCIVANGQNIPHKEQLTSALSKHEGVKSIYLNINTLNTNVILGHNCRLLWGKETISDYLCGLKFEISPLSFYQINSFQAENLYNYIKNNLELNKNDIILDLFCGIGTIGLIMAGKVRKVIGIEIIEQSVANASFNAQINGIRNANFYMADAAETQNIIDSMPAYERPNIVIVDPPRKGLDDETIKSIMHINPQKLVYVSCNPSTLARDLSVINRMDAFNIDIIQPFDMFPKTSHVECVVLMSRK